MNSLTYSLACRLVVVLLLGCPALVSAQLPGVPITPAADARTQWQQYTAGLADSLMHDWITVAERGNRGLLARLFTDEAVLMDGNESAVGREAIRELLDRLPDRSGYTVRPSLSEAGHGLLYTSGRLRYQEDEVEVTHTFAALFELHHGRWLLRSLATAPADGALATAPMPRDARTAHDRRVAPPERTLVRLVVEPIAAREHRLTAMHAAPWQGMGVGVGLEINRALELRAFGWQQRNHQAVEPLINYGGEARLYLADLWRFRPFVSLGASRFQGAEAPDTAWVPDVGGGISTRLLSHLDLQVSVRDHLVAIDDGRMADFWTVERRTQRPVLSAGLSLAVGRRPEWRDQEPRGERRGYEAVSSTPILGVLGDWEYALRRTSPAEAAGTYVPGATLYAGGKVLSDPDEVFDTLQRTIGEWPLEVRQLRVSGEVAYVDLRFGSPAGERGLITVLRQTRNRWSIYAQMLR